MATPAAQRAAKVIGIGEIGASALIAGVGDFRQFKSGAQFGAWLGIVPRQDSSGGKTRLGRITKRGDDYLRTLLIQGAKMCSLSDTRSCAGQCRVRVFLSYPSEQRDIATRLDLGLRKLGVETFFDRDALPPGESFDDRIAAAIARSHLFIFLISREAVAKGAYTLTELGQAQKRWPHPAGAVLPVFIERVAVEKLPPYLRAVSILDPSGEPVADTLNAVAELAALRRHRERKRILGAAAAAMLVAAGLWALYVTGPALLGDRIRRVLYPPVVENVQVVDDPMSTETNAIRFDVTLYNPSPEAVTTVSVAPVTDRDGVTFGSSSESFFAINRGDRRSLAVRSSLDKPENVTAFRWRMCWEYVRTEDWYAGGMHRQVGSSADLVIFIDRHKAQVCDAWRPWPDR